jgi:hypothetical protein
MLCRKGIRENPPDLRHPRSIPGITTEKLCPDEDFMLGLSHPALD